MNFLEKEVTLGKTIRTSGIYSVVGKTYRDISINKKYDILKDPKKIGAGKMPETSSLWIKYLYKPEPERIYVKEHINDILV